MTLSAVRAENKEFFEGLNLQLMQYRINTISRLCNQERPLHGALSHIKAPRYHGVDWDWVDSNVRQKTYGPISQVQVETEGVSPTVQEAYMHLERHLIPEYTAGVQLCMEPDSVGFMLGLRVKHRYRAGTGHTWACTFRLATGHRGDPSVQRLMTESAAADAEVSWMVGGGQRQRDQNCT